MFCGWYVSFVFADFKMVIASLLRYGYL